MKQTRLWLATIAVLLCSITVSAHDFELGGIRYNTISDGEVEVTSKGYLGKVTIPSTITYGGKTYSVTSIGDGAFAGCKSLTSITIPNSVRHIGERAFMNCI